MLLTPQLLLPPGPSKQAYALFIPDSLINGSSQLVKVHPCCIKSVPSYSRVAVHREDLKILSTWQLLQITLLHVYSMCFHLMHLYPGVGCTTCAHLFRGLQVSKQSCKQNDSLSKVCLPFLCFVQDTESFHVVRLALNLSQSSCLGIPSAGIVGMCQSF